MLPLQHDYFLDSVKSKSAAELLLLTSTVAFDIPFNSVEFKIEHSSRDSPSTCFLLAFCRPVVLVYANMK